jgi:hypothetical protein
VSLKSPGSGGLGAAGGGLHQGYTDASGTPGNATIGSPRGRVAFNTAATVVVTNALCAATSTVLVSLGGSDATATSVRVTPGAGTFTITANAASTGTPPCDFLVVN